MSSGRTRAPREAWRQYARVVMLSVIAASMLWLLAENVSAFMGLRTAALEGRLDGEQEARAVYSEYWYGRPGPVWAGDELAELAIGEVGFQAPSVLSGLLIRELAGEMPVDYVLVPRYGLEPRPHLNISTVKNLTWGMAEGYTYDPVIEDEMFERWRDTSRLRQFPLGVFVVKPRELPVSRFIIHTNPSGSLIYIVPAGESPEGHRLP